MQPPSTNKGHTYSFDFFFKVKIGVESGRLKQVNQQQGKLITKLRCRLRVKGATTALLEFSESVTWEELWESGALASVNLTFYKLLQQFA